MGKLSVLYVSDDFSNPGDCFSYCGARHYVNEAGVACEERVALRSTRDLPCRISISGPDLVVFAGAPWFWHGCTRSPKYAAAYALLRVCSGARLLAVGAGSCYLGGMTHGKLEAAVDAEAAALKDFWSLFDRVIVRDALAWWLLDRVGVKAELAPCPSLAVGEWYGRAPAGTGPLLLSEPLEKNFIHSYIQEADRKYYSEECRRLRTGGSAEFEWITADRTALPGRSVRTVCGAIAQSRAGEFFTARVHAALVAKGLGLGGRLQPLDSRALSASLCGVGLAGPQAEVFLELGEKAARNAPAVSDTRRAVVSALEGII